MNLEVVLIVTSVSGAVAAISGAVAAIVVARRSESRAEIHAVDAADTLAAVQDLADRVDNAVAWVEWRHVQQVNTYTEQVDRHRALKAEEARLAEWRDAVLGRAQMPVMSAAELDAVFNQLAERIGPLEIHPDDEATEPIETPAHLTAVYDGEPGHYVSDAIPEDLTAAIEHALTARGIDPDELIPDETAEGDRGLDTTVDESETPVLLGPPADDGMGQPADISALAGAR